MRVIAHPTKEEAELNLKILLATISVTPKTIFIGKSINENELSDKSNIHTYIYFSQYSTRDDSSFQLTIFQFLFLKLFCFKVFSPGNIFFFVVFI